SSVGFSSPPITYHILEKSLTPRPSTLDFSTLFPATLTGRRKLQSSADGLNLVKRFSLLERRDLHRNVPDRRGFARSAQDFTARQLAGEAVEGFILDTPADDADAF